ncbi:MAG: aminotransferase class I/II-fold pyridoxal phosphate-dependent enzyme [Alphaproteobacteria bacterium]|nr:aminotransferase class I/II-fold pyridoxal phosphate-dependent enzyme [Alphaproteobacteria bacterium]
MIPLSTPDLSGNEARYLQQCIEDGFVSTAGAFVPRIEEMVALATGARHAVATASGTSALHVALVALGVKPGDLVILPSYTFIASANAISHAGATPWLFDIASSSWTLDPRLLAERLDVETRRVGTEIIHRVSGRRVAAIMPVYALGLPADMEPIIGTAEQFGLPVLADAAAALGATYMGRPIGRLGADLTMISFNGNKTVTSGGGGAVLGDNPELVGLVRHLVTTARTGEDYTHDRVGYNYRMTNIEAAVGSAQMERADSLVAAKRRIRSTYDSALSELPGVGLFPSPSWADGACWFSGITLAPPAPPPERVRQILRESGIEGRPFWKPMHLQPPYQDAPRTEMPVTDDIWKRVLTLPCSTHLSPTDQSKVIDVLREVLS